MLLAKTSQSSSADHFVLLMTCRRSVLRSPAARDAASGSYCTHALVLGTIFLLFLSSTEKSAKLPQMIETVEYHPLNFHLFLVT